MRGISNLGVVRDYFLFCLTICNYIWMLRYLLDFLYLRFEKEQIFSRPQESSAVEHQKIYDCIIAGDAREAGKAMREHIRSVKNNVMEDLPNRLKVSQEIEI